MAFYLCLLGLTLGIEVPLVAVAAGRGLRRRAAVDAALVNLMTHPLAWLAVFEGGLSWWTVEVAVVGAEWLVYRLVTGLGWGRALGLSLAANLLTAVLAWAF